MKINPTQRMLLMACAAIVGAMLIYPPLEFRGTGRGYGWIFSIEQPLIINAGQLLVQWVPDSLLSRMQLIHCEAPDAKLAFDMAKSITGRVMAQGKGRHFSPVATAVIRELAGRTPRDIVGLLERAMVRAAMAGRRELLLDDLRTSSCPSPVH